MRLTPTAGILALMFCVCLIPVALAHDHDDAQNGDISKVNGSIKVANNTHAGNIDTVNGDISVGDECQVGEVETVNGSIKIGSHVSAHHAETVNGDISGQDAVNFMEGVETVNGSIRLGTGSEVGKSLETVNGEINLDGTHINHDIETVNGNVHLQGNTVVDGTLTMRKPHGSHFCFFSCGDSKKPIVEIGAGVQVHEIVLEREVDLRIDPAAQVGKVTDLSVKKK